MTGVQTCALPICFPVTIRGVEYVDLIGEQHEEEGDDLVFGFTKEYMHPDYASNFDKMFPNASTQEDSQQKNIKLTDSDLNQLLWLQKLN